MKNHAAPVQLLRSEANPIMKPDPHSWWSSQVTTNPAAWLESATGKVKMLYRAAGEDPMHKIYLGLAESDDGIHFTRCSDEPVFSPDEHGIDGGCIEDPRVMEMDGWLIGTYAFRPYPPGEYWLDDLAQRRWVGDKLAAPFPLALRENHTSSGLFLTKDFTKIHRAGRVTNPSLDDRDVYFFPEKIAGRYWMIHRPMQWCGEGYPSDQPAMWITSSDDLLHWPEPSTLLLKGEQPWEIKVGGNTPPIRTEHGWLTLYHGTGPDRYYRLGAILMDLENPAIVTHRTPGWLMQPEMDYETNGFYVGGGVVFPCGTVVLDGVLHVYYGGADKYVGVATCEMQELLDYLVHNPVAACSSGHAPPSSGHAPALSAKRAQRQLCS